jgi:hypothetical protein
MACSKKICCNVKFKELMLTLKTGATKTDEAGAKLIAAARKQLPKPVPGWSATAVRPEHQAITLTIRPIKGQKLPSVEGVYLFPKINYVDTTNPQTVKVADNGLVIRLPLTEHAPEEIKSISALVYRPEGWPGTDAKYLPVTAKVE